MQPTADPGVFIEEQSEGYVRYNCVDGRRWEVRGVCDHRGYCLIGAIVQTAEGLVTIESLEHLEQMKSKLSVERLDSNIDVPVGPGFEGCCPLEITVLGT